MKKSWKRLGEYLIIGGVGLVAGVAVLQIGSQLHRNRLLFKQPTNLAQKVANEMVLHTKGDEERGWSKWVDGQGYKDFKGKRHVHKFTSGNNAYIIKVDVVEDGSRDMHIDFYMTNQDFDELKTAEDFIIHELQYGKPVIFFEKHFSDDGIDGKLDKENMYIRMEKHDSLRGFTKEEKDEWKEEGIEKGFYDKGRIFENGEWVDAPPEIKETVQRDYEELLEEISEKIDNTWSIGRPDIYL